MKDQFVTYEIAKRLKELGFNEPCLTYWFTADKISPARLAIINRCNPSDSGGFINEPNQNTSAPLWQQAIAFIKSKGLVIREDATGNTYEIYKDGKQLYYNIPTIEWATNQALLELIK